MVRAFIFGPDAAAAASHLPTGAQGVNGPESPERAESIRRFVLRMLG